jgi:hypothetical protein
MMEPVSTNKIYIAGHQGMVGVIAHYVRGTGCMKKTWLAGMPI